MWTKSCNLCTGFQTFKSNHEKILLRASSLSVKPVTRFKSRSKFFGDASFDTEVLRRRWLGGVRRLYWMADHQTGMDHASRVQITSPLFPWDYSKLYLFVAIFSRWFSQIMPSSVAHLKVLTYNLSLQHKAHPSFLKDRSVFLVACAQFLAILTSPFFGQKYTWTF